MSEITVSDHALVRYIERVRGISLDEYRREITEIVSNHKALKVGEVKRDGQFTFYLLSNDSKVVTVLTDNMWPKRSDRKSAHVRRVVAVHVDDAIGHPPASGAEG